MALASLGDHRRGGPGRSARGSCARPLERSGSTIGPPCSGFAVCARPFSGTAGTPFRRRGRIVGIDTAPPRVQLALQRGDRRLEFRIGQAQDLSPFGEATFDVAYVNSVLNWIDDRPKAFGEAYRVLSRAGDSASPPPSGIGQTNFDCSRTGQRGLQRVARPIQQPTIRCQSSVGPSTPRPRPRSVTCSRMQDS